MLIRKVPETPISGGEIESGGERYASSVTCAAPKDATGLDRRTVLQAGVVAGSLAAFGTLGSSRLMAVPAEPLAKSKIELKKTVCPFCSVGCSIWAEVQNGVWIGQEPVFESPIKLGRIAPRVRRRASWPRETGG